MACLCMYLLAGVRSKQAFVYKDLAMVGGELGYKKKKRKPEETVRGEPKRKKAIREGKKGRP